METTELIEVLSRGEDSCHQFKQDFTNANTLAAEIVAFCNSPKGGRIFIGVNNDGSVIGLSSVDVDRLNQLVSNAASNNVRPAVNPFTENVSHPNGTVMIVTIPEGISKPYMAAQDGALSIWIKKGPDKRRATDREEIRRLFQAAGSWHADETATRLGISDVDMPYFSEFFDRQYGQSLEQQPLPLPQLLRNMNLTNESQLNVAGALLFARAPHFSLPAFIVKAVAFTGNDIEDEHYIDSRDVTGKFADVFQQTVNFLIANTHSVQGEQSFNSQGVPEIPRIVWEELVANALIHRDYFVSAPVRVLVFVNRVEIISPGHLPNNLTIENIKVGNSNIRNPILASFAAKLLNYRGLGSGLLRVFRAWPQIELIDDRSGNLFHVIVSRPPIQALTH
jgi:ATP-dependent DNA helicase RecG